jgi:repressor of nif and glnA expression
MELAKDSDISGYLQIGETSEDVFNVPMERGKAGIPVIVGSNAISALAEAGIPVKAYPVSTVMDYNIMKKL